MTEEKQLSMAASAIALRGVTLFLNAGREAAKRRTEPPPPVKRKSKPVVPTNKPSQKIIEMLIKETRFNNLVNNVFKNTVTAMSHPLVSWRSHVAPHVLTARTNMPQRKLKEKSIEALTKTTYFNKNELDALFTMYRKLVTAAQTTASTVMGQPPLKTDGIDQGTFRDVMHNTFDLVTEEAILDRMWVTWERGANGGEGAIKFEAWVRGLSILLKGSDEERRTFCFAVYDLNADGFITKDEMFILLKNSLLKQPGDEDPDEGVRDLVELVLRKLDMDKDGRVSLEDYQESVKEEPLLLEAFGQCLPSKRHAATFLKTLIGK